MVLQEYDAHRGHDSSAVTLFARATADMVSFRNVAVVVITDGHLGSR